MKYDEKSKTVHKDLRVRTFEFGVRIVKMCSVLPRDAVMIVLIRQLVRSGTSIGANVEEAHGAYSRADFIHCINVAKKEARETHYWLRLVSAVTTEIIQKRMTPLVQESEELVRILTTSVKTAQKNKKTVPHLTSSSNSDNNVNRTN